MFKESTLHVQTQGQRLFLNMHSQLRNTMTSPLSPGLLEHEILFTQRQKEQFLTSKRNMRKKDRHIHTHRRVKGEGIG